MGTSHVRCVRHTRSPYSHLLLLLSHAAVSILMTSIGAPAFAYCNYGSAEKKTTFLWVSPALAEPEMDDKKQSLSSKKSTSSKEMAAAEEATNRIFELAAEMQPPWTAEIVERAEDARHARVAVHVHPPASTATLTVVSQVSVGSGKLRYLKWPGALRLKKVSRTEGACSAADLRDALAEAFLSGFGTRRKVRVEEGSSSETGVGEHGSVAALSSPRQPPPSSQAAVRVRPIPEEKEKAAAPADEPSSSRELRGQKGKGKKGKGKKK